MEAHTCLECGSKIRGRVDKKFCNDQCRNAYHNRMKSDVSTAVKQINHILRHNRQVMRGLVPAVKGKITVTRTRLLQEGFDFAYHTHTYHTRNGHDYVFCYEYGYLPLENDVIMLVKREEQEE
ncbi:MAG TPA: hypothetical protein VFX43_14060 [Chitinophagaceae bacterium]|nr:hypothetical protein [Chitinophagaceae bacterium]